MNPLHRLPNGTWIDLTRVSAITPHPRHKPDASDVVVVQHGETCTSLPFADLTSAHAYADELAALVNAAREGNAT